MEVFAYGHIYSRFLLLFSVPILTTHFQINYTLIAFIVAPSG